MEYLFGAKMVVVWPGGYQRKFYNHENDVDTSSVGTLSKGAASLGGFIACR